MLKKIKSILAVIGIKPAQEINSFKPTTVQEDQKEAEMRRRIQSLFLQNQEALMARGMRPHSAGCEDNVHCVDMDCFKWVPDKIVGKPYIIDKKTRQRI